MEHIKLYTDEDRYIYDEIFTNNIYDYNTTKSHVFIDIGANIGLCSNYVHKFKNPDKIVCFEPCVPTYNELVQNTKHISNIELNNFGLSNTNNILKIKYSYTKKGSVGIYDFPNELKVDDLVESEIHIKPASNIFNQYKNDSIVLKIDCEGAEYDIFSDLSKNDLLNNIDIIMCEWHVIENKSYKELVDILNNKFNIILPSKKDKRYGMLYAFKK